MVINTIMVIYNGDQYYYGNIFMVIYTIPLQNLFGK